MLNEMIKYLVGLPTITFNNKKKTENLNAPVYTIPLPSHLLRIFREHSECLPGPMFYALT